MQITHEEARRLIHFRSDQTLSTEKSAVLLSHLKDCGECGLYANQIDETEKTLQVVMKKVWNAQPLPHNREAIKARRGLEGWAIGKLVPTRTAIIGITVLLFGFVLWQFGLTINNTKDITFLTAPQIPTPATVLLTSTQSRVNDCLTNTYIVRKNETLDEIARHFLVSKNRIVELNDLTSESINAGTRLQIPICDLTPTNTILAPTFTITPIKQTTTNTPG